MNRHLILISGSEAEEILSGKAELLIRFFKKRPDFLRELASGDLIYFRKNKGEVLGQFFIGKLIIVEKIEFGDWNWIDKVLNNESGIMNYGKELFEEKADQSELKLSTKKILLVVQIEKLEQFITSPIDTPKNRKEWVVLGTK
jgi:hypothetical protein